MMKLRFLSFYPATFSTSQMTLLYILTPTNPLSIRLQLLYMLYLPPYILPLITTDVDTVLLP